MAKLFFKNRIVDLADFPRFFIGVKLGETDEEKAQIMEQYYGSMALVKQTHTGDFYGLGLLRRGDSDCLYLERADKSKDRIHFHDLEAVIVAH